MLTFYGGGAFLGVWTLEDRVGIIMADIQS